MPRSVGDGAFATHMCTLALGTGSCHMGGYNVIKYSRYFDGRFISWMGM